MLRIISSSISYRGPRVIYSERLFRSTRLVSEHNRSCTLIGGNSSRKYVHNCVNNDNWLDFKIISNRNLRILDELEINESNIKLDDIELPISGEKLVFNMTWLRDSCHCFQCTHQHSRQRLFTIKDFKQDLFSVDHVKVSTQPSYKGILQMPPNSERLNAGYLDVKWTNGHGSSYSIDWLRYVSRLNTKSNLQIESSKKAFLEYPKDDFYHPSDANSFAPDYWNVAKINSNLTPINHRDLTEGFRFNNDPTFINANTIEEMNQNRFNALKKLTDQLVTYGIAKIFNVPLERNQVLKVAQSLAYERPTGYGAVFDVMVEPSEEINLAYSSLEFDLHSDLPYRETSPGVQLLHCIRDSSQGGLSYFSDALHASAVLQKTHPILFSTLTQFPITFAVRDPYRDVKFRKQKPVISLDSQGNISDIHYSPFTLPPIGFRDDIKLFYLALDKLTQILQSEKNKLVTKMKPGDLYIFHNRRVLHGRSAYDATTSSRFLQGCYMDWDEIECLNEKLNTHT